MKATSRLGTLRCLAIVTAAAAGLSLAACSSNDDKKEESTSAAPTSEAAVMPTAAELNDILNRAVDPAIPVEQRVDTVQGGSEAIELFEIMTQAKLDNNTTFEVMEPVLPSILPDTINVTVNLMIPDRDPMPVNGVEFVKDNGVWKLERAWACTLVENVAPDRVPPLCAAGNAELPADAPAPEGDPVPPADVPAPEGAPVPPAEAPVPPEEAPVPAA